MTLHLISNSREFKKETLKINNGNDLLLTHDLDIIFLRPTTMKFPPLVSICFALKNTLY